jgi:hypothetical protein
MDLHRCVVGLLFHIQLHNTSILAKKSRHMDRIFREVVGLELHPNMDSEDGFFLSMSRKPLICNLGAVFSLTLLPTKPLSVTCLKAAYWRGSFTHVPSL